MQAGIKTAGARSLWVNGVSLTSDTQAGDITTISTTYTIGRFQINASGSVDSRPFYGNIAEIIIAPIAVDTDTRQKIEGYLAWKWGLQANLPPGHPYENAAPTSTQPSTQPIEYYVVALDTAATWQTPGLAEQVYPS
jgi:hypothetical protein